VESEAIADLFAKLGPVRTRCMFGGQGVYAGELMFALEIDGELFLKVDNATEPAFRAAGSRPFVYDRDGRATTMSYWRLPDAAIDDPEEAARWGCLALDAARRVAARKAKRVTRRREVRPSRTAPHR
jgi:DNA transformation protein and related proteins